MFKLIESDISKIEIEKAILDSDEEHNLISTGAKEVTFDRLIEEHEEKEKIEKERYLVQMNNEFIGIIDFTMFNPNDEKPWIGLLAIQKSFQKQGIGQLVYNELEKIMVNKGASVIRLGCFCENKKGLSFWNKQLFQVYKEIEFDGKPMLCLEKVIYCLKRL